MRVGYYIKQKEGYGIVTMTTPSMRVTVRGGSGTITHNARLFQTAEQKAQSDAVNVYVDFTRGAHVVNNSEELQTAELQYYRQHYADYCVKQMARYQAKGKHREVTPDSLYRAKRTRPHEYIIQIGDKEHHADKEQLLTAFREFSKVLSHLSKYADGGIHLLTAALHADEATPHIHLRVVYDALDKDGCRHVHMGHCLDALDNGLQELHAARQAEGKESPLPNGLQLPDPDKPESRYNNRKITYDGLLRERFQAICIHKGLEIETVPRESRRHLDTRAFKAAKLAEMDEELLAERKKLLATQATTRQLEVKAAALQEQKAMIERYVERTAAEQGTDIDSLVVAAQHSQVLNDKAAAYDRLIEAHPELLQQMERQQDMELLDI